MKAPVLARRFAVALGSVLFVHLAMAGCNAENSIVGGECASGYRACGGRCVDVQTNREHCGACDNPCSATCEKGMCSASNRDGGDEDDAGEDDVDEDDAGDDDGSLPDGGGGDGCPPPPYVTPAACGACGVVCTAPTSACLQTPGGAYACALPCTPPLVACGGVCVDLENDPENCGACGKFCPSNICMNAMCQGATPGDVVVIGHDYRLGSAGSSQAKILTNAVFMPRSNPLRVLSYEQYADAAAVARVKSLVQQAAAGRQLAYTVSAVGGDLASTTLGASYDVVLLYDQVSADAGTLAALGASSATSLNTFAKQGGVVIALDGGTGAMPSFVTGAGLLSVAGHTPLPASARVVVSAPADRVGSLVVSPYAPFNNSATLASNEPESSTVVFVARQSVDGVPGAPVVVHKIVP